MGTGVLRSTRGAAAASVFPSVTADAQFWYYLAPGAVVEITEASGCVGATQQSSQRNERQKEHGRRQSRCHHCGMQVCHCGLERHSLEGRERTDCGAASAAGEEGKGVSQRGLGHFL